MVKEVQVDPVQGKKLNQQIVLLLVQDPVQKIVVQLKYVLYFFRYILF